LSVDLLLIGAASKLLILTFFVDETDISSNSTAPNFKPAIYVYIENFVKNI
jgi:hypothetical protein